METEKEILDEFVADAKEHLDTMEDDLLALEKQKNSPEKATVDRVFRAVHSIKGAAGFFGLENIGELAHVMETLLSMIRAGEICPESRFIDALLAGCDHLGMLLDNAEYSNETDITDIHDRLSTLLARELSPEVKAELSAAVRLSDSKGADIDFHFNEFMHKNIPGDMSLFVLTFNLTELDRSGRRPLSLIRELTAEGQIMDAKISLNTDDLHSGLPDSPLMYDVLLATAAKQEETVRHFGIPADRVRPVSPDRMPKEKKAGKNCKSLSPASPAPDIPAEDLLSVGESGNVRIHVDILDRLMMLAGELVLIRNQKLLHTESGDPLARRLHIVTGDLQEGIMRIRMQPLDNIYSRFPRIVRELGEKLGKKIQISLEGGETDLDKNILESLADPMIHMLRNACGHGIESPEERKAKGKNESGMIRIRAGHDAGHIHMEISDDGKGIDPAVIRRKILEKGMKSEAELAGMNEKDMLSLILLPGFSTADTISEISGRGVGMDVVKTAIEKLGGGLTLDSVKDSGTRLHLQLPLTLAIIPSLNLSSGGIRYAVPQVSTEELICLYDDDIDKKMENIGDQEVCRLREQLLPMVRLSEVLARPRPFTEKVRAEIAEKYKKERQGGSMGKSLFFAVLKSGEERFGLIPDSITGSEEIVVKPMHNCLRGLHIYAGTTVMGDGKAALILDARGIAAHAGIIGFRAAMRKESDAAAQGNNDVLDVLVFRCGKAEQFALPLAVIRRIEKIRPGNVEKIGEQEVISLEGRAVRILRPEQVLSVSPCEEKEEMFLLLPRNVPYPVGLLISELGDVVRTPGELNVKTYMEDGLSGTALIQGRMTLFPDIYRICEIFSERYTPEIFGKKIRKPQNPDQVCRVLLVEDTPFFRQLVKRYLQTEGYAVTTAENGREGLKRMEESFFDLIVSDIEMPVMDGWSFIQNVRTDSRQKDIPAVALTALDSEETRQKAEKYGFNRYEVKIDKKRFLKAVSEICRNKYHTV